MRRASLLAWVAALAACAAPPTSGPDGGTTPGADGGAACDLFEGATESECALVRSLVLPIALPAARGNRHADEDSAAQLGFALFFRADLGNGVSCAACHLPELDFTDRMSVSTGLAVGTRNAPTVFNAARLTTIFWDGRADSLWSQPLFAIENDLEMGSSRLALAHQIADTPALRSLYETTFGAMPDLAGWPPTGRPGEPSFDAMTPDDQHAANLLAANVGRALEAYMRRNSSGRSPFDRYVEGDRTAMIPAAARGLRRFVRDGCVSCHGGPMLTDEGFHRVDLPSRPGAAPDRGRAAGAAVLAASLFRLDGPYADGPVDERPAPPEADDPEGAFRTPSLRNVAASAPYGHDGALATIDDVLRVHAPTLDATGRGELSAFLRALTGDRPALPWSDWPARQ